MNNENTHSIGIFDSGLGGLTIAQHIQERLPRENILFLADHANLPYGEKSHDEIARLIAAAVPTLITEGAKVVVIGCNSASLSIIEELRLEYPGTPFVAVVPSVKTAAEQTKTGTIAVFATQTTLGSPLYTELKERHAKNVTVIDVPCPEWVGMVESGTFMEQKVSQPVRKAVESGADQLVLGCTHYPFLTELVEKAATSEAVILQSGPAVARQVERILIANENLASKSMGSMTCLTSGDPVQTTKVARQLTGQDLTFNQVG